MTIINILLIAVPKNFCSLYKHLFNSVKENKMRFIIVTLLSLFSLVAQAEQIFIAESSDKALRLYGISESISVTNTEISMMMSMQYVNEDNFKRLMIKIRIEDCRKGFGPIYKRQIDSNNWENFTTFVVKNPMTMGDLLGSQVCTGYFSAFSESKKKKS